MRRPFLKIIFLLIYTGICCKSVGQNFNPYYNFRSLNVQNGLVQNIAYHFFQDSRGYMWIGTRNGISLFDGTRTINFQHRDHDSTSLGGNFITRILEDSNHVVWIGNDAGFDRFNQNENRFTHFSIPNAQGQSENGYCVLLGFVNKDEFWFIDANAKSVRSFHTVTHEFRTLLATDIIDGTLRTDPISGTVQIWSYLSNGTTHFVFKQNKLIRQDTYFDGKKAGFESMLIFHVFPQNDSTIWLATAKGLLQLDPISGRLVTYNKLNAEPVSELRYICQSPAGQLWLGTGNAGIFTFDPSSKKFVDHFGNERLDPFSLCSNNIVAIYFDRVGNAWSGSYGGGISYAHIENNIFHKYLSKTEIDQWKKENNISWLGSDSSGNIWCMVQDVQGFWRLDSALRLQEFRKPVLDNGIPFIAAVYKLIFDGREGAWCITDRGLFYYNIITNQIRQVNYVKLSASLFGSYWIRDIIRLHDGRFLFSTFCGVYQISKYNGETLIKPFSAFKNAPIGVFDKLFEDHQYHIYVKGREDTLYRCIPDTHPDEYRVDGKMIFHPEIYQFQEFGPEIYMATNDGLFTLRKKDLAIEKPALNQLLPFATINNLLVENNHLWLFGERGLYQYDFAAKNGRLFSVEDGLPSNEFKEYAFLQTKTGTCIVGTKNGILSFDTKNSKDLVYPPRAQLTNMYVNDSSTGFLANPQECSRIVLEHNQNIFSFDYSCISFLHGQASSYEYKLEGFDKNWIRGGTTNYTRYSGIPPGKYIFQLRALDAKGKISPYTKSLAIEIRKAYWQTNVFRIAILLLAAFLIGWVVRWYLRIRIRRQQVEFEKLQAIEKERTRIATDMHDDLGAGLSRIKFLSETIAMKKQQQVPIESEIGAISNYANEMIGKMGEIVWALNEKNDSLSDLLSYTRAYATEYLLSNGIRCEVEAPVSFPAVFVSGEFRRNIYLTMKEALHNIVKHAGAGQVKIKLVMEKNLVIEIHDNGTGFNNHATKPFRNGLNNMKKRMADISGSLEIIHQHGTRIILTAPLPA